MTDVQRDLVGRAALVVGGAGVLVAAGLTMLQPFALRSGGGVAAIAALSAGRLAVGAVLGLVALLLGLVALLRRRPASPTGAGGAALGAVLLLESGVGVVAPLLYS